MEVECSNQCRDGFILRRKVSTGEVITYVCPCPKGDVHRAYFDRSNEKLKYGKKTPSKLKPIADNKPKQYKDD